MADHNKPTTASAYASFVNELDARLDDVTLGLDPAYVTPTNLPTNAMRFSSAASKWQRYNGAAWVDAAAGNLYSISISGSAGSVTNGVATTGSYADPSWITSLAGSKITGDIGGNSGSATVLQTARTINGVSFNGSANIAINLNNNLTFNNVGTGAASGVNYSGSTATTISYNTIGAPSAAGANASGTWGISISGNAATASALAGGIARAQVSGASTAMMELHVPGYSARGLYLDSAGVSRYCVTNGAGTAGTEIWVADAAGNFTCLQNVTAYSDERLKTNWRDLPADLVGKLSQVKVGVYDRTDSDTTQIGVSAQSLQQVMPWAVLEDANGMLSVSYGNAALAACVALSKEVVDLKARLAVMEAGK